MPSFTKFESVVGRRTRRLKRPRSVGPSQRAVMTPVTMPIPAIGSWPPKTRVTSLTKRGAPFFLAMRPPRGHRIEGVAAGRQHGCAEPVGDAPPEGRHLALEGIRVRIESLHV